MSAQFMRRNIRISVRLTEDEQRLLKEKMERIGVTNQEAFLRKMVLDGLVIKLDLPEMKQMILLLRYTSNNINQIAKRLNESGRAYDTDFSDIMDKQEQLWPLPFIADEAVCPPVNEQGCRETSFPTSLLRYISSDMMNSERTRLTMKFILKILLALVMLIV